MHSIKSAARKQAWYHNNDPENRTYNFFGRPAPNRTRSGRDIEKGDNSLAHTQTENDARSPIEDARRAGWNNPPSSAGMRKAGTFPSGPPEDRPKSLHTHEAIEEEKEKGSSTTDTASTPTGHDETSVGKSGARKRKFHIPKFGLGKKKDDNELTPTKSRKSSKSKAVKHIPFPQQLKIILFSWINILLVFVPIGLAFEYAHLNGSATFIMNFIAIIPLASMLSFATEELAYYVGETFGGLLNASFGNATELIVSIIALTQGKIVIVQTSLIGSLLSNLLLVLGMCFFFGGINRMEQFFNITVAQTAASLLALAIGSLVTPTAFRIFSDVDTGVTPLSRAAAVLLLITYICYLFFQLRTHIDMYNEPSQKSAKQNLIKSKKPESSDGAKGIAVTGASPATGVTPSTAQTELKNKADSDTASRESDDEEAQPQLGKLVALAVLAISTALIAVTSDGMVSAIDSITGTGSSLSEEFVGLILIPIVGNAAEHATAVTVAIKDKMDLAIGVAVGSSLQIALLVIPVMVIISWIGLGQSVILEGAPAVLDLNFDGFQVVVLFIAIILVNYVIQDGRSHWLEGIMLFITYVIFAVAAWYYPAPVRVPT